MFTSELQSGDYLFKNNKLVRVTNISSDGDGTRTRHAVLSDGSKVTSLEGYVYLGKEVKVRSKSSSYNLKVGKIYTVTKLSSYTTSYNYTTLHTYLLKELPGHKYSVGRFEVVLPNEHLEKLNDYCMYEVTCSHPNITKKLVRGRRNILPSKKAAEKFAKEQSINNRYTYYVSVPISSYKGGLHL